MSGWTHAPGGTGEAPYDIAVIMPTMLRSTLLAAVRSVFAQDFGGTVQILLGIDSPGGDRAPLERIRQECPASMAITVCDLGYATAMAAGVRETGGKGGILRAALSWLAHARYLAYLDDDNWWAPDHLSSLRTAIAEAGYAWAQRWMVRAGDDVPLTVDHWISAGPEAGLFKRISGGLVDSSCLMLDRQRCADVLWRWSRAAQREAVGSDQSVFKALGRKEVGVATGKPTVFYRFESKREHAVRSMMDLPVVPQQQPAPITLERLRLSLEGPPEPAQRPSSMRRSAAAPPENDPYRQFLRRRKPRSIVDLWAGNGQRSLRLAQAARAEELAPSILAIDTWLPVPDDDRERGPFAMQRHGVAFGKFQEEIGKAGAGDLIWSLPGCPRQLAAVLAQSGLQISVVALPGARADATALLRGWWPLLREGGAILIDSAGARGNALQEIGRAGIAMGGRTRQLGEDRARLFVVAKPRREGPLAGAAL